ncbi:MAG: regulatory iron-sulfur-containing complex subunit RicT [Brevinema sp.]
MLKKGMHFVASTKFGDDMVEIQCPKRISMTQEEWEDTLKKMGITTDQQSARFAFEPVLRHPAKESEIQLYNDNSQKAAETLPLFKEKIQQHNLQMKIMGLHFTLDRGRLVCTYTADSRVDFRELVKELGVILKHRIEMFQISVAESMKFVDTCGSCGRQLCCSTGCTVGINNDRKGAKASKFLGVCGRTRCCSYFENE